MVAEAESHDSAARGGALSTERARDALLAAFLFACVAFATARARHPAGDWSYFADAADDLSPSRWTMLYVDHPRIQTGPLTIAVAWLLDPLGLSMVRLAIVLVCLATLSVLLVDTRKLPNARWRLAIGGAIVTVWWPQLSYFGHVDDAIVLLLAVIAIALTRRDRLWTVAVFVGLAIAVKPTAVFMLALVVPTTNLRSARRWGPAGLAVAVGAAIWAPFVLASRDTLDALRPRLPFMADSVAALVNLDGHSVPAAWRLAQLLLVVGLAVLAMYRSGPAGVLWVGTASRLLLDPAAWPYYTVGFVLGALVWEMYESSERVPWRTVMSGIILAPSWLIGPDVLRAALRLVAGIGALAIVLVHRRDDRPGRTADAVPAREQVSWRRARS